MGYDLWAWAWAENDIEARPEDIVSLELVAEEVEQVRVPGVQEFLIPGKPHDALAPFDPDELFAELREHLGRHFNLSGPSPSLLHVELHRDAEGRGWRLDFSLPAELVSHLLPVGLGRAFYSAGLVLYDAWKERIVRPGWPKTRAFEVGGAEAGVNYEPTWTVVKEALEGLEDGGFAVLQNRRGDYVQCAGSADRLTVECRLWSEKRFHHWVAGGKQGDATIEKVIGPGGPVELHAFEVLTASDAARIFKAFFDSGDRHQRYRWRDISATFG